MTRRGFLQAMFAAAAAPAIVRAESLMRIAPPTFMGIDFAAGPDESVLVPYNMNIMLDQSINYRERGRLALEAWGKKWIEREDQMILEWLRDQA